MPLTIDGQANSITSSTAGVNIPATVGTLSVGPSGSYMNVTSSGVAATTITTTQILNSSGRPILNSTGSILQVVSNFSNTLLSGTADFDIISQSITPTSTNSQILIMFNCNVAQDSTSGAEWGYQIQRNGTPIKIGTTYGTSQPLTFMGFGTDCFPAGAVANGNYVSYTLTGVLTDSPGTTSAVTYKARVIHANGATNVLVGRTGWSGTSSEQLTVGYSITLMEVSG